MPGREGGKMKPLKAPKKEKAEPTPEEIEFAKKKREEAAALKAAQAKAVKGGPPGGGIKKSGKKT
ncbi:translation machinery associated TMA7 [Rickenella mellea]|uniref:Translation machinery associated TMA7 n=1 Tax=Rickenella mellea TaxID=50990 RepID=A0A4Y7QIY8_9AGAM|nr:translation machinery associated TMA7 [Rickenella mellea]